MRPEIPDNIEVIALARETSNSKTRHRTALLLD
jgi:hypothetical protein